MSEYYDRYQKFRNDGYVDRNVPFIPIKQASTDLFITFDARTMRLDTLSYKYYNDANYAWLILQANPSVPTFEYLIDTGTSLRIPYPLDTAISRYEKAVQEYNDNH